MKHKAHAMTYDGSYQVGVEGNTVKLIVVGWFDDARGKAAVNEFEGLVDGKRLRFVADLSKMTGYDRGAREVWATTLCKTKENVIDIRFLGVKNPLIRMAASTVALAVGIRMTFVDD